MAFMSRWQSCKRTYVHQNGQANSALIGYKHGVRPPTIALLAATALGVAACAGPDSVTTDPATRTTNDGKLTVTPAVDTTGVGESVLFRVAGDTQHVVGWTFSDTRIARITDQNGGWVSLQTLREGSTTLTATRDGESGRASLVVLDSYSPDTAVAAVRFGRVADTVSVSDSTTFGINVYDVERNSLYGRPVTWTLSDSTIARIGVGYHPHIVRLQALRNGVVTLTATVEGQTDCARLIVGDSIPSDAPRCPMRPIASFEFAHPTITAYLD